MTVAELIAALQKLDPYLPVWTAGEWDCPMNRVRVKTVVNGPCDSFFGKFVVLDYKDPRYTRKMET